MPYVVLAGRASKLAVAFNATDELPDGQRAAFYWLLDKELGGDRHAGSIFTSGEGVRLGYRTANLAVDAVYQAGVGCSRAGSTGCWATPFPNTRSPSSSTARTDRASA